MKAIDEIRIELNNEWIPDVYESEVRPLRTRSYPLNAPQRENAPSILNTLLGTELQVGRRRIQCPDIATARFLQVFARLGCREVAVPYDITKIAGLADKLETAWKAAQRSIEQVGKGASPQQKGRIRASVIRAMREEVDKIGAGEMMPLFNKGTKQRGS
ncbi:MAG: hypothetical protein H0V76_09340 [Blastocatellia bacterium]|nr:hypothetical protein [Blastocatellia bacterium]